MDGIQQYRLLLAEESIPFSENELMSAHTTFRIGGAAAFFVTPETEDQLSVAAVGARECGIECRVLGRGSNVLFADKGYGGAVVSTERLNGVSFDGEFITCGSGAGITQVAQAARDRGLSGLEFAYGIPGSVGGAVYMNAGAFGGEIGQVLKESTFFDPDSGKIETISLAEHKYGYRESVYIDNPQRAVLSATLRLSSGDIEQIRAVMDEHMAARRSKQPLEFPSAGSVFKRCEGHFTGKLIEDSGLKGYKVGGAQVSEKHAGFIVNTGSATADDVLRLVEYIKETVYKNYGLSLECEMIYIS